VFVIVFFLCFVGLRAVAKHIAEAESLIHVHQQLSKDFAVAVTAVGGEHGL